MLRSMRGRGPEVVELGDGLVYAVGDIHGRLDLLLRALEQIEAHAAGRPATLVLLGDYVDRGPESRGVVERLMDLQQRPGRVVCLKGNHEDLMVRGLTGGAVSAGHWLDNGGLEALRSYGAAGPDEFRLVPEAHLDWMEDLPLMARDRHRLYVHAGVAPGRAPERQSERTCLWIRERFLEAPAEALPAHVVHGHTPEWAGKPRAADPELLPHRTNLDTGAWHTGVLGVAVFDAARPGGPLELLG